MDVDFHTFGKLLWEVRQTMLAGAINNYPYNLATVAMHHNDIYKEPLKKEERDIDVSYDGIEENIETISVLLLKKYLPLLTRTCVYSH